MKNMYRIREILDEIEELENDIEAGSKAWGEDIDPYEMAGCDPSDQFCKGMEVDELIKELKTLVGEVPL